MHSAGMQEMRVGKGRLDHNLWLAVACLIVCAGIFVWASGRGYDINDESYYLMFDSAPRPYHFSISLFGFFWHPLYKLVGGNIALLRIAGASILVACSAVFAFALQKFSDFQPTRNERYVIVLSISTSAFWFFTTWLAVPSYNELNLCALLLFFSGLLTATASNKNIQAKAPYQAIGAAIVSGASLGVMALAKPTTCAAAVALGITWLILLRPPKALFLITVSAVSAITVLVISILLIDGSFSVFFAREMSSLAVLKLSDRPGDMHGIVDSVIGPFSKGRVWKVYPAIALGAAIFGVCLGIVSTALGVMKISQGLQRGISYGLVVALGVFVALARAVDLQATIAWYNYHAWNYTLPLMVLAIVIVLARTERVARDRWQRRLVATFLVASAPIAYSIGTNVTLMRHMVAASVFWAASALLICTLASPPRRTQMIGIIAFLCGAVTIGLLLGVVRAPLPTEASLTQQTEQVSVGPDKALLRVDKATADYITSLQHAAVEAGFKAGTPIVDLSDFGPGIVFALSGSAPGIPWLADNPDMSVALAVLKSIPRAELQHAWIITGSDQNFSKVRTMLTPLDINFPAAYQKVIAVKRDAAEWQHSLWKPLAGR